MSPPSDVRSPASPGVAPLADASACMDSFENGSTRVHQVRPPPSKLARLIELDLFLDPRRAARQFAQVVELRLAHIASARDVDARDDRAVRLK